MKCTECGEGTLNEGILNIQAQVRGESIPIQFPGAECPMCGFQEIDSARMAAYGLATADAYRVKHGLLTSDELRSRRRGLGMSQVEFANHTKASLPSIKRWELGAIQDEAMDELIRLKTDAEAARKNLDKVGRLLEQPNTVESLVIILSAERRRHWQTDGPRPAFDNWGPPHPEYRLAG